MKIFYKFIIIITILMVFFVAESAPALPVNHLILIDTSNSMKFHIPLPEDGARSSSNDQNFKNFLKNEILGSKSIFKDGDAIAIRSFNDLFKPGESLVYRPQDQNRLFPHAGENTIRLDQTIRSLIQERIGNKLFSTHYYTDLLEGLKLGYLDISHYLNPSNPTIIWMVTDNEQDLDTMLSKGKRDITPFYHETYQNKRIEMTYFIPIITNLQEAKDNLICYAFFYGANSNRQMLSPAAEIRDFMARVEDMSATLGRFSVSKGKYSKAIRCKPALVENFELDRKKINFEAEGPIGFVQNGSLLQFFLVEGVPFYGKLYLRFKSRSEYWKIKGAHLENPTLIFTNNEHSLFAKPRNSVCRISPREITLEPNKSTQRAYELVLGYGEECLFIPNVAEFSLNSFLPGRSDKLTAKLCFKLPVDIASSQVSLEYRDLPQILSSIQMLPKIKDFMYSPPNVHKKSPPLECQYLVEFNIKFKLWRKIVFWLFFPCIFLILISLILAGQKRVLGEWQVEDSSRKFSLRYFEGSPIRVGADFFGKLRFLPLLGLKFFAAKNVKLVSQSGQINEGRSRFELNLRSKKYLLCIDVPAKRAPSRRRAK